MGVSEDGNITQLQPFLWEYHITTFFFRENDHQISETNGSVNTARFI